MKYLILGLFIFLSATVEARVFNMGKESFGSYLRTTYGTWDKSKTPFENSSSNTANPLTYNTGFTTLTGYEFGFLYNYGATAFRFGFELIQPPKLSDITGTNAGSIKQYDLGSELSVVTPKFGIEFNLKTWKESRAFFYGDYGLANLTLQNSYEFTTAGQTTYGLANFREEVKATASTYSLNLAFETLMSDTTTICLEGGYRFLKFAEMKHNVAVTNFQGTVAKGDKAYNEDGTTARSLDLSGPYVGLHFRFWIY